MLCYNVFMQNEMLQDTSRNFYDTQYFTIIGTDIKEQVVPQYNTINCISLRYLTMLYSYYPIREFCCLLLSLSMKPWLMKSFQWSYNAEDLGVRLQFCTMRMQYFCCECIASYSCDVLKQLNL